jgi:hypothetical protein
MDVAMALPVSWNPLVKSKPSAVATTSDKMMNSVVTTEVSWSSVETSLSGPVSSPTVHLR